MDSQQATPAFEFREQGDIRWIVSPALASADFVSHGFSTRSGGTSPLPKGDLSLSPVRGDNPSNVEENRKLLAGAAGFAPKDFVFLKQVHGTEVCPVEHADELPEVIVADALYTRTSGPVLTILVADCFPVVVVDEDRRAVGIAHGGWRGITGGIMIRLLESMQERYGTDPTRCKAAIGPGIRSCCFEVREDVVEVFRNRYRDMDELSERRDDHRLTLSLPGAIKRDLLKAGLKDEAIHDMELCTSCRRDLFFSHRRDSGKTGRSIGWVQVRPLKR